MEDTAATEATDWRQSCSYRCQLHPRHVSDCCPVRIPPRAHQQPKIPLSTKDTLATFAAVLRGRKLAKGKLGIGRFCLVIGRCDSCLNFIVCIRVFPLVFVSSTSHFCLSNFKVTNATTSLPLLSDLPHLPIATTDLQQWLPSPSHRPSRPLRPSPTSRNKASQTPSLRMPHHSSSPLR
jgi:hypothetical protein